MGVRGDKCELLSMARCHANWQSAGEKKISSPTVTMLKNSGAWLVYKSIPSRLISHKAITGTTFLKAGGNDCSENPKICAKYALFMRSIMCYAGTRENERKIECLLAQLIFEIAKFDQRWVGGHNLVKYRGKQILGVFCAKWFKLWSPSNSV